MFERSEANRTVRQKPVTSHKTHKTERWPRRELDLTFIKMKLTNVSEADAELVYAIKQAAYFEHSVRT